MPGKSAGQWVAERNRGGLGEKPDRDIRKELRESCAHQEVGSPKSWRCGRKGILQISCNKARKLWRDGDEKAGSETIIGVSRNAVEM